MCTEMLDLYQVDGIIAEPAGALATAALGDEVRRRAGREVVCLLSGGNNDVSRYAEVVERSLVHRGLKHYFLVEFPQEPGALRRFLDEVLGPDDDIVLFEYVKRDNRETGAALVGVEISGRDAYEPLWGRMEASPLNIQLVAPGTTGLPVPGLSHTPLRLRTTAVTVPHPAQQVHDGSTASATRERVRHGGSTSKNRRRQNSFPASRAAAWAARRPVSASAVDEIGRGTRPR